MKGKFTIFLLLAVFLTAGMGVSGTLHYCAGTLRAVSMESKAKNCNSCSTTEKHSCCKEEAALFQYDDFQFQKTDFIIKYIPSFTVIIPYFIPLTEDDRSPASVEQSISNPFLSYSCDAQSLLSVFLI